MQTDVPLTSLTPDNNNIKKYLPFALAKPVSVTCNVVVCECAAREAPMPHDTK